MATDNKKKQLKINFFMEETQYEGRVCNMHFNSSFFFIFIRNIIKSFLYILLVYDMVIFILYQNKTWKYKKYKDRLLYCLLSHLCMFSWRLPNQCTQFTFLVYSDVLIFGKCTFQLPFQYWLFWFRPDILVIIVSHCYCWK